MLIAVKNASGVATEEQLALAAEYKSLVDLRDDLDAEIKKVQTRIIASMGGLVTSHQA